MNRKNHSKSRSSWGPLLILLGPQFSRKTKFLSTLAEPVVVTCLSAEQGLYHSVSQQDVLMVWRHFTSSSNSGDVEPIITDLQSYIIKGISLYHRLVSPSLTEMRLVAMTLLRLITVDDFRRELLKSGVVSNEESREILLDEVETMLHKKDPQDDNKLKFKSEFESIQIPIRESLFEASQHALRSIKHSIKATSSVIAWDCGCEYPVYYYKEVLHLAAKYRRVVRFVRWGQELPVLRKRRVIRSNLKNFLKTGRYVETRRIDAFFRESDRLLGTISTTDIPISINSKDYTVEKISHDQLANQAGFSMTEEGIVAPISKSGSFRLSLPAPLSPQKMRMRAAAKAAKKSEWFQWTNNSAVFHRQNQKIGSDNIEYSVGSNDIDTLFSNDASFVMKSNTGTHGTSGNTMKNFNSSSTDTGSPAHHGWEIGTENAEMKSACGSEYPHLGSSMSPNSSYDIEGMSLLHGMSSPARSERNLAMRSPISSKSRKPITNGSFDDNKALAKKLKTPKSMFTYVPDSAAEASLRLMQDRSAHSSRELHFRSNILSPTGSVKSINGRKWNSTNQLSIQKKTISPLSPLQRIDSQKSDVDSAQKHKTKRTKKNRGSKGCDQVEFDLSVKRTTQLINDNGLSLSVQLGKLCSNDSEYYFHSRSQRLMKRSIRNIGKDNEESNTAATQNSGDNSIDNNNSLAEGSPGAYFVGNINTPNSAVSSVRSKVFSGSPSSANFGNTTTSINDSNDSAKNRVKNIDSVVNYPHTVEVVGQQHVSYRTFKEEFMVLNLLDQLSKSEDNNETHEKLSKENNRFNDRDNGEMDIGVPLEDAKMKKLRKEKRKERRKRKKAELAGRAAAASTLRLRSESIKYRKSLLIQDAAQSKIDSERNKDTSSLGDAVEDVDTASKCSDKDAHHGLDKDITDVEHTGTYESDDNSDADKAEELDEVDDKWFFYAGGSSTMENFGDDQCDAPEPALLTKALTRKISGKFEDESPLVTASTKSEKRPSMVQSVSNSRNNSVYTFSNEDIAKSRNQSLTLNASTNVLDSPTLQRTSSEIFDNPMRKKSVQDKKVSTPTGDISLTEKFRTLHTDAKHSSFNDGSDNDSEEDFDFGDIYYNKKGGGKDKKMDGYVYSTINTNAEEKEPEFGASFVNHQKSFQAHSSKKSLEEELAMYKAAEKAGWTVEYANEHMSDFSESDSDFDDDSSNSDFDEDDSGNRKAHYSSDPTTSSLSAGSGEIKEKSLLHRTISKMWKFGGSGVDASSPRGASPNSRGSLLSRTFSFKSSNKRSSDNSFVSPLKEMLGDRDSVKDSPRSPSHDGQSSKSKQHLSDNYEHSCDSANSGHSNNSARSVVELEEDRRHVTQELKRVSFFVGEGLIASSAMGSPVLPARANLKSIPRSPLASDLSGTSPNVTLELPESRRKTQPTRTEVIEVDQVSFGGGVKGSRPVSERLNMGLFAKNGSALLGRNIQTTRQSPQRWQRQRDTVIGVMDRLLDAVETRILMDYSDIRENNEEDAEEVYF